MVRICRAEDGEVFHTNATVHDIEGSGSLEAFLRKEIGIEEDAVIAYLSDGRKLRTDNLLILTEVDDQTIFVFNKYYMDRDHAEVAKLLHIQSPLQPPIEDDSQTITPLLKLSGLGAAFLRAAETHVQSINRIVDSMRHQGSALRLASSVVDFHVLNISDVVADARQELDRRASLVDGVDGVMELASRVRIHHEFMPPAVKRAMDAGGPPRTLDHYVSGEKISRAVEEFRSLQERFRHIEGTVKQFVDAATDARLICDDVNVLHIALTLEPFCQRFLDRFTAILEGPVVNVELVLHELRWLDEAIRNDLSSIVGLKNTYTSQCLRALRQIHTLNAGLATLPEDFAGIQASLETKGTFSDIERLHNMIYAYGATMVEVVRRKEFARLLHRKSQGFSGVMSNLSAAETRRRQVFRDEIIGQLPFDLIGMDESLPSVQISVSEGEGTNNRYTLSRHDINDLLRVVRAPNDKETVPVTAQAVCTNLEGLVGNIDAPESGFNDLMRRSRTSSPVPLLPSETTSSSHAVVFSSSKQPVSWIPLDDPETFDLVNRAENSKHPNEEALNAASEPGETVVNDHKRVESLERELRLARAQLESETAARRALEDRLGDVRWIFEQYRQGRTETGGSSKADQDALVELRAVMETVERQLLIAESITAPGDGRVRETQVAQSQQADSKDRRLLVQLLDVASAYRKTCTKSLAKAHAVVARPSTVPNNSDAEEVEGPSERQPTPTPPVDVDLSDPAGAIEVLRSFDHDGLLEAVTKTGTTIRKWQRLCKGYRERSKGKITFRNFAEGDLALFLPTRNSQLRPWAAFNVSFPHYFLQATGHLAEQLTTREWIVARITSILERVVETNVPESNPYGLGDGVKYYMVQVEDWNLSPKQRPSKNASRPGAVPAPAPAGAGDNTVFPEE